MFTLIIVVNLHLMNSTLKTDLQKHNVNQQTMKIKSS